MNISPEELRQAVLSLARDPFGAGSEVGLAVIGRLLELKILYTKGDESWDFTMHGERVIDRLRAGEHVPELV